MYLKVPKEELWRRIEERRAKGVNADSAGEIGEELLEAFVEGFEVPDGEGEVVCVNRARFCATTWTCHLRVEIRVPLCVVRLAAFLEQEIDASTLGNRCSTNSPIQGNLLCLIFLFFFLSA